MRAIPNGIQEGAKYHRRLTPAVGLLALVLAVGELMVPVVGHAEEVGQYQGPCALALSKDSRTLYVACTDARQVAWVDLAASKVTRRVDLPAKPTGLVRSTDGTKLIVTCAAPKSTVVVLDAASGKTLASIPAGHTAMGPAIAPDGKRLYVCNRFDNDVSVIDLAARKELTRVKVVREPVAAAVTPDGKAVFVANHLPNTRTDLHFFGTITAVVTVIDTQTNQTTAVELQPGSHSLRDLCISHDGKHVYVTHLLCNFEMMPTQVDAGWIHSNVFTVIDTRERKLINTVGLDESFSGVGNPWGAVCTADGKSICVSHAGSHQLSVVDTPAALGKLIQMFTSPWVGAIAEDQGAE